MPNPISPALAPYLSPTPQSLTIITSVLDPSANWLLLRYIYAARHGVDDIDSSSNASQPQIDSHGVRKVVFISLAQSLDVWREIGRKCAVDINALLKNGFLHYVDGLGASPQPTDTNPALAKGITNLVLSNTSNDLSAIQKSVEIVSIPGTLLILDGLDILLASGASPSTTLPSLQNTLMTIRSHANIHATIVTAAADAPLLHSVTSHATPLETAHRSFVTGLAHQADWVVQVRGLDTGPARDVSGVVRVSRGGACDEDEEGGESLYQWKQDGSVRVWGRGE